ncbi:odorant receptor 47a-like isoform X2 [Rhodnius prolixus]|uniref:odorant receptor 47a-like isoform X2 n=1 Tax=Rhodnius prolixus TaxID=13249 RepID=UPI003D18C1ED
MKVVELVNPNLSPVSVAYSTLRFTGLMNQEGRPWSLVICAYHIVAMNCMGITSGIRLFSRTGSLPEMIEAISAFTIYLHVNAKAVNVLRNQKEIRQLLEKLEEIRYGILQDVENRHHLLKTDNFLAKLTFSYGTLFLSYPFLALIMNLIIDFTSPSVKPHLVLQVWVPWSMKEFWPYIIGMVAVMLLSVTALIYYVSFSILLYTYSFQMSAFLKILQARLIKNGPRDPELFRFHAELLRLLRNFNKLFSGQLYLETILSSLQPCGFGFALIKAFKKKDPGAFDLLYKSFMAVLAPFIVCACGQVISTQVGKLHESSYLSRWYEEHPKIRKNLLTMMGMTVRPTTLNYRIFTAFDYICFARVVQGIYSYLMMIINLETDD